MKHTYPTKLALSVAFALCAFLCNAQTMEYLDTNNIKAGIGIGASLFTLFDTSALSNSNFFPFSFIEVPKGYGTKPIFTASLWMLGRDNNGLHCAHQTYAQGRMEFSNGPIKQAYDVNYDTYFNRTFKVTGAQISQFSGLHFPVSASQIDSAILKWPGKGNPWVQSAFNTSITDALAPFVDVDADGVYNPLKGDYPKICGDEAVFFVYNDERVANRPDRLGVEVRGLAYVFYDATNAPVEKLPINNTVFVSYDIENKSQNDYTNFYVGLFEDPDLGCAFNDRVGCDTNRNLMFVYNGTSPDNSCQNETGYGLTRVSQGIITLDNPLASFIYYTNDIDSIHSEPKECGGVEEYMSAFWLDGTPFTVGGVGFHGTVPTHYAFPGDPTDANQWSEVQPAVSTLLPAGDRRFEGSIGPINFNQHETKHFDFAFLTSYANDTNCSFITIVDTLKRDADRVQFFYDNNIAPCRAAQIASGINNIADAPLSISVYPNPTNNLLNVECSENIKELSLLDVQGRLIVQKNMAEKKSVLDVASISKGIYLLQIKTASKQIVRKIIVD